MNVPEDVAGDGEHISHPSPQLEVPAFPTSQLNWSAGSSPIAEQLRANRSPSQFEYLDLNNREAEGTTGGMRSADKIISGACHLRVFPLLGNIEYTPFSSSSSEPAM